MSCGERAKYVVKRKCSSLMLAEYRMFRKDEAFSIQPGVRKSHVRDVFRGDHLDP